MAMITSEIIKMPVKDRLILMEKIWDSLKSEDLDSPHWHMDILRERKQKIRDGKAEFISIDELRASR